MKTMTLKERAAKQADAAKERSRSKNTPKQKQLKGLEDRFDAEQDAQAT